jgi:hypothetical protein
VLIQSTSLVLRDRTTPVPDPNRRKLQFKSTTRLDAAPHQIVVPARGTPGDPTPGGSTGGGAVLQVYNSNGSGEAVSVPLPASGWSALDDAPTPRGYKYKGLSTDAVTRVVIRGNLLRIRGGKASWAYTLDEPSQGRIAVRMTMGSGFRWCADAPAKTSGNPPSTASNDRVDKFVGARKTPPPAACPAVP